MGTFVAIVIIVAILWLYINHKIKENEEEEARKQRLSEERYLQKEYPDGFNYYKHRIDECIVKTAYTSIYSSAKEYRSTDEMISLAFFLSLWTNTSIPAETGCHSILAAS